MKTPTNRLTTIDIKADTDIQTDTDIKTDIDIKTTTHSSEIPFRIEVTSDITNYY